MCARRGNEFRRCATERLLEYLAKGFTLNDERLKTPPVRGSALQQLGRLQALTRYFAVWRNFGAPA